MTPAAFGKANRRLARFKSGLHGPIRRPAFRTMLIGETYAAAFMGNDSRGRNYSEPNHDWIEEHMDQDSLRPMANCQKDVFRVQFRLSCRTTRSTLVVVLTITDRKSVV